MWLTIVMVRVRCFDKSLSMFVLTLVIPARLCDWSCVPLGAIGIVQPLASQPRASS
jgi:hypothetical protein